MYNRYVPQPDGSFHRNRIADQPTAPDPPPQKPPREACDIPPVYPPPPLPKSGGNILGFFKNLLPKNIDTGDLIIVLLLLLLANDHEQDRNHALLTLALYFFL